YIWLLKVRPATEVSTYAYVNPIVAVILSMVLTDEVVTSFQLAGLVIILVSVLLINWSAYDLGRFFNRNETNKTTRSNQRVRAKIRDGVASLSEDSTTNEGVTT